MLCEEHLSCSHRDLAPGSGTQQVSPRLSKCVRRGALKGSVGLLVGCGSRACSRSRVGTGRDGADACFAPPPPNPLSPVENSTQIRGASGRFSSDTVVASRGKQGNDLCPLQSPQTPNILSKDVPRILKGLVVCRYETETFVTPETISPDLVKKIRDLHRKILPLPEMLRTFSGTGEGRQLSPPPLAECLPPGPIFPLPAKPGSRCLPPLRLPLVVLLCSAGRSREHLLSQGPALARASRHVRAAWVPVDHSRRHRAHSPPPPLCSRGSQDCPRECL